MTGRSIKIFLVEGVASGLRTAELGLSTIKAVVVPRASLSNVAKRPEPKKTGVYILIGSDSENVGLKKIYIGEGDTIIKRLNSHNKDEEKEFWEEAILFVSKDDNLTKSHVRYLESRLISLAKDAKRATLVNGTSPNEQGILPEPDEVEMEEFITQARLLLGTLGYDIFEPSTVNYSVSKKEVKDEKINNEDTYPEFTYSGDCFNAKCIVDTDAGRYIVKAESLARKQEAASLQNATKSLREQLIQSGVLAETENEQSYKFTQDYSFSSISSAAQVVSGSSINGRQAWKKGNMTYAEWQESRLEIESDPNDES